MEARAITTEHLSYELELTFLHLLLRELRIKNCLLAFPGVPNHIPQFAGTKCNFLNRLPCREPDVSELGSWDLRTVRQISYWLNPISFLYAHITRTLSGRRGFTKASQPTREPLGTCYPSAAERKKIADVKMKIKCLKRSNPDVVSSMADH